MNERLGCAHCEETGTCHKGTNGDSCAVCSKNYLDKPTGLVCSVCGGRGTVEPHSLKLQNRFLPYFSMGFMVVLLAFLALAMYADEDKYFDKVLGFVSAMVGSITAYYFGGKTTQTIVTDKKTSPPL